MNCAVFVHIISIGTISIVDAVFFAGRAHIYNIILK